MRINLVKRLNSGSNPNNNATQNEKNKYPEDIGQAALEKLRIKATIAADPIIQTMKAINHFVNTVMSPL